MTVPGEIPGFGKGVMPPNLTEAESFLDEVDDVSRLIEGLHSGKISPEYVDKKIKQRDAEESRAAEATKAAEDEAERKKYENLPDEKKLEVKQKVDDMIREKERREKARELYAAYRASLPEEELERRSRSTDYSAWDLWTPSDDEDDPWMQYMPNDPAFKAMEADIDKRHARRVEQRQTAYRKREEGNAAFKAGQYAEALAIYEAGLEADKRSIELHGNAAMAALKSGCFVQTIEHCDKACEIAEFFLERPSHPVAVKCLQRRATARLALGHLKDAVSDLKLARERDPANAEVAKRLASAEAEYEEARKEKEVERGVRRGVDVEGTDVDVLREFERVMRRVATSESGDASTHSESVSAAEYARLEALLETHEACRVYARAGGGVGLDALRAAVVDAVDDGAPGRALGPLRALRAACLSEANREALAASGALVAVVAFMSAASRAKTGAAAKAAAAAAFLLHACSASETPRRVISSALAADGAPGGALDAALSMLDVHSTDFGAASGADSGVDARLRAAHALSLLGNCALEPETKAALRSFGASDASRGTVPGRVAAVLRCGVSALAERAAAMLGNLCGDAEMRAALAEDPRATLDLVALLPAPVAPPAPAAPQGLGLGSGLSERTKQTPNANASDDFDVVEDPELAASVLAALSNALVEPAARRAAAGSNATVKLLALMRVKTPETVAARAATSLSRLAREANVAAEMCAMRGEGGAAAMARFVETSVGEDGAAASSTATESAVRALTVLIAGAGAEARRTLAACAARALVGCVAAPNASDGVVGNAALAVADLAKETALLPALEKLKPVAPLLRACHSRTGAAQKNAAIACARLAHHPEMLETLKENNGLELIYRYVRP